MSMSEGRVYRSQNRECGVAKWAEWILTAPRMPLRHPGAFARLAFHTWDCNMHWGEVATASFASAGIWPRGFLPLLKTIEN